MLIVFFFHFLDKDDKCSSPDQFYCEDATCIHKSLECNGKFNCRSRFDEDGCQVSEIQFIYFTTLNERYQMLLKDVGK